MSKTGLPAIRDVLNGDHAAAGLARPVPGAAQPDPQLAVAAPAADRRLHLQRRRRHRRQDHERSRGDGTGHYLRQFQPIGPETLSFAATRDPANRGNTYPPPLWLADARDFSAGGKHPGSFALPSWDCNNTGAPGDGSEAAGPGTASITQTAVPACWVAPPLASLLGQSGKFPHVNAAKYSNK